LLLNGRDLKDILIVDNKVESYSSNLENGIPIESFLGDPKDKMLLSLKKYLINKIYQCNDVRDVICKDFFLKHLESDE
jgi:CTD nuclear envelope phosphatase 1